jgi:hypothetical protein
MLSRMFYALILASQLLTFGFGVHPAGASAVRVPGVHVGDWARYDLTVNYTTNDPNPPVTQPPGFSDIEYFRVEVQSIVNTNITFEGEVFFKNGSSSVSTMQTDVVSGYSNALFFIAANLSAGDKIYEGPSEPTIDATLNRTYAGAERSVNHVQVQNDISPAGYRVHYLSEAYWDRESGIVCEVIQTIQYEKITEHFLTYASVHLVIKDTNIWRPNIRLAHVSVMPQFLNPRSEGRWVTVLVELPRGCKAKDVDLSSITLNGTISEAYSKALGNRFLLVKFERAKVISFILRSVEPDCRIRTVVLTITGRLKDGTSFQGSDTIRIINTMPRCERYYQNDVGCWLRLYQA